MCNGGLISPKIEFSAEVSGNAIVSVASGNIEEIPTFPKKEVQTQEDAAYKECKKGG